MYALRTVFLVVERFGKAQSLFWKVNKVIFLPNCMEIEKIFVVMEKKLASSHQLLSETFTRMDGLSEKSAPSSFDDEN